MHRHLTPTAFTTNIVCIYLNFQGNLGTNMQSNIGDGSKMQKILVINTRNSRNSRLEIGQS